MCRTNMVILMTSNSGNHRSGKQHVRFLRVTTEIVHVRNLIGEILNGDVHETRRCWTGRNSARSTAVGDTVFSRSSPATLFNSFQRGRGYGGAVMMRRSKLRHSTSARSISP